MSNNGAIWHVWSVNVKQHRKIISFLKTVPEVSDWLVPIMEKEYRDKRSDKKKIKEVPLYGNYIFLKYDAKCTKVTTLLTANPFFYRYLGVCSDEEACRIEDFKFKNYREFLKEEDLHPGMKVKLIKEPFKGIIGTVKNISGENIYVLIKFFGRMVETVCKIDELRTELWNASEDDTKK